MEPLAFKDVVDAKNVKEEKCLDEGAASCDFEKESLDEGAASCDFNTELPMGMYNTEKDSTAVCIVVLTVSQVNQLIVLVVVHIIIRLQISELNVVLWC